MEKQSYISFDGSYLGTIRFTLPDFPSSIYEKLDAPQFHQLSSFEKYNFVNALLLEAISQEKSSFLLPHVVSYICRIKAFLPTYHLSNFEFWLNHYLAISEEKKLAIRGKITGKDIPRSEYQNFFPMEKEGYFFGAHFSYAHFSPDLDTTVASFSCFLSAFSAKLCEGRHYWVVPEGPPKESIEIDFLFKRAIGKQVFSALSFSNTKFSISCLDLISQKNIVQKKLSDLSYDIDPERGGKQAVLLIDEDGYYLGDWRASDVEAIRSIIIRFCSMLSEYQNKFIVDIITLFTKKSLHRQDWMHFIQKNVSIQLKDCLAAREFTEKQKTFLDRFIQKVLCIPSGYHCTAGDFFVASRRFGFGDLQERLMELSQSALFNAKGELIENRNHIFTKLEEIVTLEREAFGKFLRYIDSLEVALAVKQNVFGRTPNHLSHLSEYEEVLQEIKDYHHLTVTYQEDQKKYPLGVIYAEDLQRKILATTSWNDFSSPHETDLKEGVAVISFIDHHKSHIKTDRPALGIVRADAQASNSIIAKIHFEINDRYTTGGMSLEQIEQAIKQLTTKESTPSNNRLLQRLLQKKGAFFSKKEHYISPDRELLEYLQYTFAILDDTDLLTKATEYDVTCMASLLNRLKSLMLKKEVEVIHFDDLAYDDPNFAKKAAKKLLQTPDLYSLYGVIYQAKEKAINRLIQETASGKPTHFFQDTKILGGSGYAAVGQFKHFAQNEIFLSKHIDPIRECWVHNSLKLYKERKEINLHMFMFSTIPSAEELFKDIATLSMYQDEIWFWIPEEKKAIHYLSNFLQDFHKSPKMAEQSLEVLFLGRARFYEKIFTQSFGQTTYKKTYLKAKLPLAILKVKAASIKSRKTDIAIYL